MTRQEWSDLKRRLEAAASWGLTPWVLAMDVGALVVALWLQSQQGLWRVAGTLLLSLFLLHCYLWLHEATHSAVSRNRGVNDWVGHICGWLIFMPYPARRRSHLLHHVWTGHPKGDPANQRIIQRFSVMNAGQARRLERIWKSWLPLLTLNDRIGLWRDPKAATAARIYGLGYLTLGTVALLQGRLWELAAWYLPPFLLLLFLEELVNLPHHAEAPLLREKDRPLPYWEQNKVTHSCRTVPIWSRFVLLNFNLHTAHHLFPSLPWSALPTAHRLLEREHGGLAGLHAMRGEITWSLVNRRRPLLEIMGHYLDQLPKSARARSGVVLGDGRGGSSSPPTAHPARAAARRVRDE